MNPALKPPHNHDQSTEVYRTHCEAIGRIIAAVAAGTLNTSANDAIRRYITATGATTERTAP